MRTFSAKSKQTILIRFHFLVNLNEIKLRLHFLALFQLTTSRPHPPPLSFDPILMKDVQCAEPIEKNNFPIFAIFIFWVIVKIHRQLTIFRT